MNLLTFANKAYNKITRANLKLTFSQCGEDTIMLFLINSLKLKNIQYFDFGTNDPRNMNNTYLMYLNGYRGVCVEPDPYFHKKIKKYRPGDLLVPAGVSAANKTDANFYVMDDPTLNTFSPSAAKELVKHHQRKIREEIVVPLIPVNEIFEQYWMENNHVIVSLDVEGLDLQILRSLDLSKYRPCIICVETLSYTENLTGEKDKDIAAYLAGQGYMLYADTHINSIFVDKAIIFPDKPGSLPGKLT